MSVENKINHKSMEFGLRTAPIYSRLKRTMRFGDGFSVPNAKEIAAVAYKVAVNLLESDETSDWHDGICVRKTIRSDGRTEISFSYSEPVGTIII